MRKFAAVMCVVLGLATLPNLAQADPIGTNSCAGGAVYFECDIFVDDTIGKSVLDPNLGFPPGWLAGYSFLLKVGSSLSDGLQEDDVAHALVIGPNVLELYTPTIFNPSLFSTVFNNALAGLDIDGVALAVGQTVGTPLDSGVAAVDGIGYFPTADTVMTLINWADGAGGGGQDLLRIHTGLAPGGPGPNPVPEPGTLSLMLCGAGSAIVALRRRRARVTA